MVGGKASREVEVTVARAFAAGVLVGPRVLTYGWISMTAGHGDLIRPPGFAVRPPTADGPTAGRRMVRECVRMGGIKIFTSGGTPSIGDRNEWRNVTARNVTANVPIRPGHGGKAGWLNAGGKDIGDAPRILSQTMDGRWAVASGTLQIGDILDIRHPEAPRWGGDGRRVWFGYIVDGRAELWSWTAGSEPARLSRAGDPVSAYALRGAGAVYAAQGTLVEVVPGEEPRVWFQDEARISGLDVSRDGRLAWVQGGRLWMGQDKDGALPRVSCVPTDHPPSGLVAFSPNGARLLVGLLRYGALRTMAVVDGSGSVIYEAEGPLVPVYGRFLTDDTVALVRMAETATVREVVLVRLEDGETTVLYTEEDYRGIVGLGQLAVSPAGDACAFMGTVDGFPHLLLWERDREGLTTLLPGPHEDHGEEHEVPSFSRDGRRLVFASSHGGRPQDRRIYMFDRDGRTCEPVTEAGGTKVDPALVPDGRRVAYLAASGQHSLELFVRELDAPPTQVTQSMSSAWQAVRVVEPEHLELTSLDGHVFYGDLYRPPRSHEIPGPALVYAHGGPMRQMRAGFHPMHAYAVFHAWNQYLLQRGYTILSVDYRGGTGYGVDFERGNFEGPGQGDLGDVIAGARYLKRLPEVDPSKVGIWGLSYGGYLTLLALTKFPDEFRMGVNLAGMWTFPGPSARGRVNFWQRRVGGPRSPATEPHYHEASPAHFAENLRAPLLSLHGTADESVEFEQLNRLVRDLTHLHKRFELMYYPDETHFFHRRETWEDAFARMERTFARDLAGWTEDVDP